MEEVALGAAVGADHRRAAVEHGDRRLRDQPREVEVAAAVDVGEAGDGQRHAVGVGVAAGDDVGRGLAGVVGIGGAQREVLAVGQLRAGAVGLVGGGEDDPLHPVLATGLEDVPGAAHVDFERLQRRLAGDADDRLRRQVEDRVAAGDRRGHRLGVAQVALGKLDLVAQAEQVEAGAARPADVGEARVGTVEHANRVAALQQRPDQVRGDEPVRAGDQRGHDHPVHPPSGATLIHA